MGSYYNTNHGNLSLNIDFSDIIPTVGQLGYKAITGNDGSYTIRAVPYFGNATAYKLQPRLGIHTFEPAVAIRAISSGSQNHTVDFTDKSTFTVKGTVMYEGGNYPIEGCQFRIDGVLALNSNGTPIQSIFNGDFSIKVPVGTHEVKVEKNGHSFTEDGRRSEERRVGKEC